MEKKKYMTKEEMDKEANKSAALAGFISFSAIFAFILIYIIFGY